MASIICVSIGRGRHKMMIAEHRHLVEQGAPLVELRLDYIVRAVNLRRLLDNRSGPVIITCRRERDGGKWTKSEDERQMLLRSAIAAGVEYVDLEDDTAASIPRYGKTKRIVSYHNFQETPEDLEQIHQRLASLDADIVKIATMAHHPHDGLRMLQLVKNSQVPTVGLCMGEYGMFTRILAGKFGAPMTYATFHQERTMAPGQLSYQQMTEIYRYNQINADTEVFGVIGDPIGHSHSPLIHNAGYEHLKMNRVYVPFRVPREDLHQFIADCRELGVKGLSVTIPHKESALEYLDKVDGASGRVGAANTMIFAEDGTLVGHNTDYKAAVESLETVYGADSGEEPFRGKTVLILGAGGAAKAIAFALVRRGANVTIASRTFARAEQLAEKANCRAVEWAGRHSVNCNILVNCTPLGMHPNLDESPYDERFLQRPTIVFDTVYNPEQTLLIKQAKNRGCRVVTGVEMFVRQGAMQFTLFTGEPAPIDVMRNTLRRAIGAVRVE